MAKPQNPRSGRGRERQQEEKFEERREKREEHLLGAEHKVFGNLIQRRLGGGAPPTAQAYARAMQQWQKLPGAVGFTAVPAFPKAGAVPLDPFLNLDDDYENGGEPE